jgi:predicted nucleotidyltransferase component of viral defense system
MLFLNTVKSDTYELLKKLMQIPELSDFVLVGGTNLSLKFGHRISVDLDLFTNKPFDTEEVLDGINRDLPQSIKLDQRKQTIWLNIDGIKVDIILHQYPYLQVIEVIDGVRFMSVDDIIPMKLEAMATRGVKKDFWDINELLNHYSLPQMVELYQAKYPNSDVGHVLLSMTYFVDAEQQKDNPEDLKGVTWEQVKINMRNTIDDYVRQRLSKN